MRFWKYHALGNDYIVMDANDLPAPLTIEQVKIICHRNFGVGSDGILLGPLPSAKAPFGLRIYNPDGSQAEKSGNGLRIFSRYLWDRKLVGEKEFTIETAGGVVKSTVFDGGKMVRVEMGKITFWSNEIPVAGPRREVINEQISVGGETFTFCAASVGNPHCVVVGRVAPRAPNPIPAETARAQQRALPELSESLARQFGPLLEVHPNFPNRTNVQFLKVLDRANIQIEIWERGAGYTLASGSSSSAAAAVAHKLGLCDGSITVHMPGGQLAIEIGKDFDILMTGPVTKVGEGKMDGEIFSAGVSL
ncbi:MAG TPA: diaminopimelate epimerase [Verrucomicrobiae bacterium]|jgi:diaminopimelate epimerase|nr:diaminopimelate epimerase [Verrucomicrobiae bacterium]